MNELVKIDVSFEYSPTVYCYLRKTGWYWKFKFPNGAWFYGQAAGDDEKAVRRNARLKERELAKGFFSKKEAEKFQATSHQLLTFEIAIENFIDHLKTEGCSPNYYVGLEKQLKSIAKYFKETNGVEFVHKLNEDHAYEFRKMLLKKVKNEELKKVTAFGQLNDIKRLFKWLKRRKKLRQNPWVDVEAIAVPKDERARRVAPPSDILPKLMEADYKHRYDFPIKEFAYTLYRTGVRTGELLHLEVEDADWDTGRWLITNKKCPTKHGEEWTPKYNKSRVVIIPEDVLVRLRPLIERAKAHRAVGYCPGGNGKMYPEDAGFIFTMKDRELSKGKRKPVYKRVDNVRGAWGALFVAAGLADAKLSFSPCTKKYKNGHKLRTDVSVPFTRHDMRRGFNLAAKEAGMSLDDRALILGHHRDVNENHYCGKPQLNTEEIQNILNNKMWKEVGT